MRLVVSAEDGGAAEGDDVDEAGLPLPAPAGAPDLADHYDLTISHPAVDTPQFVSFDRWLARAAADLDLSCALIHAPVVHEAVRRLTEGRLRIGYHLDYHALWHVADDPYARLAEAVVDAGGRSVNPPARSRAFTDKAAAHAELTRRGLGTPATVIVRPWCADRELTAEERRRLRLDEPGARVYVKPANGFSGHGVVRVERTDPDGLKAALAAARDHDRREAYLIQREVRPPLPGVRRRPRTAGLLAHFKLFGRVDAVLVGFAGGRRPGPAELPPRVAARRSIATGCNRCWRTPRRWANCPAWIGFRRNCAWATARRKAASR